MKKNIKLRLLIVYVYAFVLMYSPNLSYLVKIDNFMMFGGVTALYICIYMIRRDKKYFSYFKKKPIFIFIVLNIFATFYYAVRTVIAGTNITDFYNMRIMQNLMPIVYLVGAIIVYYELTSIGFNRKEIYKFIINVVLIQSLISIAMIFIDSFRNIAYNIFYTNHEFNEYITKSRLYGICDGDYTYGFQILHSVLALFILMYAYFYKEKRYVLYSLLALLVTFLNGRFGIIIFAVGLLYFIIYLFIKSMNVIKIIKILLVSIIIGTLLLLIIYTVLPNTFILIEHAYNDITSFLNEENEISETASLVSMIFFPTGLSFIFGCGFRIFGYKGEEYGFDRTSDVGFVNDAFMGGIIYMSLIYYGYYYIIRRIKSFFKGFCFERTMCNLLILSVILANIKGEVFRSQLLIANVITLLAIMLLAGGDKIERE